MAVIEEGAPAPAQQGVVVQATDVTRRYGEGATAVDALRGISLGVESGQLVAVLGPSGSGKSTLMHILAGLDKPTSGNVRVAGEEITTLADAKLTRLRRRHIGFVFQFFNLLPMLTAEENIVLPLSIAGDRDALLLAAGELGRAMLAAVGQADVADHLVDPLAVRLRAGDREREHDVLLRRQHR
jgi:ABC-type lipoprotein export system ATPase subunit